MDEARRSAAVKTVREWLRVMEAFTGPDDQATSIAEAYRRGGYGDEYLGSLISQSGGSQGAWDGLLLIAQRLWHDGEPIPRELQGWLIDVAKKRAPRPSRDLYPMEARNDFIAACVLLLVDVHGFNATRSCVKRTIRKGGKAGDAGAGDSACDVVGQVFHRGYSAIETIWLRSLHHRPKVRAGLERAGVLLDELEEKG